MILVIDYIRQRKMERYKRNFSSISEEEQNIIGSTKVAIVGLGGLGGYVVENLVRLGIMDFNLIDYDVFEESNLNRQVLSTEENLGKSKLSEALNRISLVNSKARAIGFKETLNQNSVDMLNGVDIVFDCLDSIESRLELELLCDKLNLPLIHGAIGGYYGQVAISSPNNRIYHTIYKDAGEQENSLGNLSITCMVVASFQVNLFLRLLSGNNLKNQLILINVREMEISKMKII